MLISHQEIHSLGSRDDIEESSGGQGGDDLQEQDGEEGEAEADGTREESQNQAGDNTTGKHIVQCTWWVWSCTCIHVYTGGKVCAISLEALARYDIVRDPTRSRKIPWLRVRLREMMEWREATGLRAISRAYN